MQQLRQLLIGGAAALLLSATGASAQVFTSCTGNIGVKDYDIADNVGGTEDCTISDQFNDLLNPSLTVNGDPGFFDYMDWLFGGKDQSGGGQSGTWNIDEFVTGAFEDTDELDYLWMLVFKDGKGTTLVGYLIEDDIYSGSWTTPFENPPFLAAKGAPKDVSHISYYYRTEEITTPQTPLGTPVPGNSVPEPATLGLLGLGLAGLLATRRRTG